MVFCLSAVSNLGGPGLELGAGGIVGLVGLLDPSDKSASAVLVKGPMYSLEWSIVILQRG